MGGKAPGAWHCHATGLLVSVAVPAANCSHVLAEQELGGRQHSTQLFKPFMAAQSISEEGGDFENSSRSQSSQASQEVLMRPGVVSANGGPWYTHLMGNVVLRKGAGL